MYCCAKCFTSTYLKKHINSHGIHGNCDFCGSKNVTCIEPFNLYDLFLPLLDLFQEAKYPTMPSRKKVLEDCPDNLPNLIEKKFLPIFTFKDEDKRRGFWKQLCKNGEGVQFKNPYSLWHEKLSYSHWWHELCQYMQENLAKHAPQQYSKDYAKKVLDQIKQQDHHNVLQYLVSILDNDAYYCPYGQPILYRARSDKDGKKRE